MLLTLSDPQLLRLTAKKLKMTLRDADNRAEPPGYLKKIEPDLLEKVGDLRFVMEVLPQFARRRAPEKVYVYERLKLPYFVCVWDEAMGGHGLVYEIGYKGRWLAIAYLEGLLSRLRAELELERAEKISMRASGRKDRDVFALQATRKEQLADLVRVERLHDSGDMALWILNDDEAAAWLYARLGADMIFRSPLAAIDDLTQKG